MSNYIVTATELTEMADAIREKGGTEGLIEFVAGEGFKAAIEDIPTGSVGTQLTLRVIYPAGYNCVCACNGTSLSDLSHSGDHTFNLPFAGTWTVTVSYGTESSSYNIAIVANYNLNALVPAGYTIVDHITSHGTEYIDTGVVPSNIGSVEVDVSLVTTSGNVFNSCADLGAGNGQFGFGGTDGEYAYICGNWGNDSNKVYTTLVADERYVIYVDKTAVLKVNQETIGTCTAGDTNNVYAIYLFASNNNYDGYYLRCGTFRLYGCKIRDPSNALVRDFIPCIRNSDTKPGLYDTIGKQFYVNGGSGEFDYE